MNPLAVILVSGGMDSCVTAALAAPHYDMAFLHLNYGQRTQARELKAFKDLADFYHVERRLVIDTGHLHAIGGSSLTDENMKVGLADLEHEGVPETYVPFRNANILAMATSWAEVLRAKAIFIGAVEEDSSGYPDCTKKFFEAFNAVIATGTKPDTHIEIKTPIIDLQKEEIIRRGLDAGAPLHLTWSCYQNEDKACGVCDSCALRLRGFQAADLDDPIPYVTRPNY